AQGRFQVLITLDKGLPHQQNLAKTNIAYFSFARTLTASPTLRPTSRPVSLLCSPSSLERSFMWVRPANLFAGPVLPCFPQAVSSSTPAPGNANLPIGGFMVVSPALAVMTALLSFNLLGQCLTRPARPPHSLPAAGKLRHNTAKRLLLPIPYILKRF